MKYTTIQRSVSMKRVIVYCFLVLSGVAGNAVRAQDSVKKKNIEITSTFKPVLREASKIQFNAAPPVADTLRPELRYTIPSQNLQFGYRPADMNPVSLPLDTSREWSQSNYIKLGFGNVHLPYIQSGFSFGRGRQEHFQILAEHYTSKGKLKYQQNSLTRVALMGTRRTANNLEWNGRVGFTSDNYYLYGYRPEALVFTKQQLRQGFQTFEGRLQLRNTVPTAFGLTYNPSLRISYFSDRHDPKSEESNTVVDLPFQKTFHPAYAFRLSATADLTRYQQRLPGSSSVQQNRVMYVSPTFQVTKERFYLHAGLRPSWDNGAFHLLPNLMADLTTGDQRFTFQLGWIGYYDKGSYQRFAGINPWLARPDSLRNTRMQERYAGFKGTITPQLSYSAKVGFLLFRNAPLFVNDPTDGKTFQIRYEDRMQALQLHGEVEYLLNTRFSANASLQMNQFTGLRSEEKAWGMIPLELKAGLRWQLLNDLWVRSDLWAWTSPYYRKPNGEAFKQDGGFDINVSLEFRLNRKFNAWLQLNNIIDSRYERWNQYQVFGFNMLAGIAYSFNTPPER